ncbi:hypothetical protein PENSPDRAFT_689373 [Peniophora sp. CONT]|nr:hypothetical protein PENSPDRAFT_689373 [Peniophora sp. CONT]
MATPPHNGARTHSPEDPRDVLTPQQTYHRPPRHPYAPRQRSTDLPVVNLEEEVFVGPPDAPGQTGAYHARRAHRNGEYRASSDSPPRIPGRVTIDESAPRSPLLVDAATTRISRSPSHAPHSPPPEYGPSPRVENRTSLHVHRSPTPDPRNTRRPHATSSRAAPSPGHTVTPAHRPTHRRSPTPGPSSEPINRRQARSNVVQQSAPSAQNPAQLTENIPTSASPQRRISVQPPTAPAPALAQYTETAPSVAIHTSRNPASAPDLVLAQAPSQHPSSSTSASADPASTAAKRARDAEHVQARHRRVRQKQEIAEIVMLKAEAAALKAEAAQKDVQSARKSAEFAEMAFKSEYATRREDGVAMEGVAAERATAVPGSAALAMALQAINGSESGSYVPPSSGFAAIDALNARPGECAIALERMVESLGFEHADFLRDPERVFDRGKARIFCAFTLPLI